MTDIQLLRTNRTITNGRRKQLCRARKFAAGSLLNAALGQTILLVCVLAGSTALLANAASVAVTTPTALFYASRWVWNDDGPSPQHWTAHLPAFAGLNFAGLVLSSVFITVAAQFFTTPVFVNIASAAAWGSIWAVKFFVLDRRLGGHAPAVSR